MISTGATRRTAALCVGAFLAATPAGAQSPECRILPGTYVLTITDIEGVFASRGIMTLSAGGSLVITDSRQGGQTGVYEPFTVGQGAWSCRADADGAIGFSAISLTFTAPPGSAGATFGRVDYSGEVDRDTGGLSGTLSLRLSEARDLEGANPLGEPGEVLETFDFVGRRVARP